MVEDGGVEERIMMRRMRSAQRTCHIATGVGTNKGNFYYNYTTMHIHTHAQVHLYGIEPNIEPFAFSVQFSSQDVRANNVLVFRIHKQYTYTTKHTRGSATPQTRDFLYVNQRV